jgi:ABC-type multidrug transport system ATPase subunit
MITLTNLSARIAGRLLIDNASLALPAGTKAGFVGRNGAGKSTLFKIITGDMESETGSVFIPRNARIGQVAQEAPGTEEPLIEIVLKADREREALLAEAETATDPHRIAEIHMRLADIQAHSAESRAASILAGLGFDSEAQLRPASSFSGGWRMRVALAAVLFSEPDLLLLDEPTNYLDLEGTLWLEDYISRYPHTVIIISHDRDLLNTAVNAIVHLDQQKLTFYRGSYDQFERQRAEANELQTKAKVKNDAARKFQGQGIQGPPGAEPRQGARTYGDRVVGHRRSRAGLQVSGPGKGSRLADHRYRKRRRGLSTGKADPAASLAAHRHGRPDRAARFQRKRQIHLCQDDFRTARYVGRLRSGGPGPEDRLLCAAPARRPHP